MSPISWNNFLTYGLQIGLLVGLAGWIPAAARLRSPKARLVFFQVLLAACLLLPALRPWKSEVIAVSAPVSLQSSDAFTGRPVAPHARVDPYDVIFAVLALGIAARLGMLALGLLRLRRYRLRSVPLAATKGWGAEADIRVSHDITGPVTFGFLRPVILLPAHFPDMPAAMRDAILCHETLHVRRRDWLFTAAEELIRAGLWFHPAIWWLLGEIQLTREQAVDREAVDMTNARDLYVDALLAAAGAAFEADLAPAPLFLRKRHLKQRVVSILKEKRMSKTRTVSTLATGLALLAGACWYVTGALPLSAQPQLASDSLGVTVDTMGSQLMHRAPVLYPRQAMAKNLEGVIVAQVKLDENGNVSDASILSGPDEFRAVVLQSLLSWHFAKDAASSTRQVSVKFHMPAPQAEREASPLRQSGMVTVSAPPATSPEMRKSAMPIPAARQPADMTVRAIQVDGLGVPTDEVLGKLPLHVNDTWTPESMAKVVEAAHQIDEHLRVSMAATPSGVTVHLSAPTPPPPPPAPMSAPPQVTGAITVAGRVQAAKLISQTPPVYPQVARQARISGTVELAVLIGPDGHPQQISVLTGHPLMRQAALDAVKEWVYAPTLLNEKPVAVSTTVDVIFSIDQ